MKNIYDVYLLEIGPNKAEIIKIICKNARIDLMRAYNLISKLPAIVIEDVSEYEARKVCEELTTAGARAVVK